MTNMGLFRDWLTSARTVADLEHTLKNTNAACNEYRRERDEAWGESNRMRGLLAEAKEREWHLTSELEALRRQEASLESKIELFEDLLERAVKREAATEGLVARLVTVERHNATYQATTQWAVAHINSIAIERGSLIDRLDDRRGIHPVPQFQLETPDVSMTPPDGPIGAAPNIMGRPIPEGMSAGDAINALRAKREREASQRPVDAADLVKSAADLFEEVPEGSTAADSPATDPFSDLELP